MKRLNLIFLSIFFTFHLFGQDNNVRDIQKIIKTLINQETSSIIPDISITLLPTLDRQSLQFIKLGLSQDLFIRNFGKGNSDSLRITEYERKYIDSCVSQLPNIWTQIKLDSYGFSNYILTDTTKVKQQEDLDYDFYQIMQPIFIRNNRIAFVFYKSVGINFHLELSIMTSQNGAWVLWDTILVYNS